MTPLRIVPIVEGHGEVNSVPSLLTRMGHELYGATWIQCLTPFRLPRSKILKTDELVGRVELAFMKAAQNAPPSSRLWVPVLFDADKDCPRDLAEQMSRQLSERLQVVDFSIVVANVEFESWFVAAAESLTEWIHLAGTTELPRDPEVDRCGKGWIQSRFRDGRYSETIHQKRLTSQMNLADCHRRSRSFRKLCSELEKRISP